MAATPLLGTKEGKPLSFVAAVQVIHVVAQLLDVIDKETGNLDAAIEELRKQHAVYRATIQVNARYGE